jgi:hypothetical protein
MAQSPPYSGPTGFIFVATHDRALMMLGGQATYSYVEVWERARLVCRVRKGE